ncbi:hypothetical protein AB1Y20_005822 [Prymnesium parvum]|uniref:PX domain-containing protein n=1 Tax=Prymnesium parvum TaxID=97485 RepID=A0AB34J425_PRYPA|mmetsp:Transcript_16865/g.42436  ORF Transcript_16865/g.42436 Transcript_16865/m.42436 type:complete len:993 (+) Transcript_16865:24-3002(+)
MAAPSSPQEQPPLHGATASGLYVRVEDERRERSSDGWEYSSYTIVTTYQGQSFSVQRRFREFRQLHSQLLPHLPTLSRSFPLWGNILNRYSPEVIEARKAGFARYLTDVIGALQGAEIPPPLRAFLQLPQAEEAEAQHAVAAAIPAQLEPTDHAILVAYQLPLNVERAEGGGFTVEWDDNAVLNKFALNLPLNVKWVGCISLEVSKEEEEALSDMLLEQYNCVVVFLGAQLQQDFYHGFCRTYLRPIFHCQLCLPDENDPFSDLQWRAYCTVNKKFAEKVMEVYEPGHMTWVHDYHLLLLPSYILRRHRTAHVGLFLHSPFPASDIFRTIAVREELLRAMLNADLIGFLLFEYTRNFLTCCKRMLGLEYEFRRGGFLGVEYGGRHVMVQVSTFGVSPPLLQKHIKETPTPESQRELLALRADLSSRRSPPTVIAGVDYLDRFKGVQLKLLAWESTLRNYPQFREGYVLVQICLASRNQVKLVLDADKVASEIKAIVKRINAAYPGTVYYEQREKIMTETRMAMWQLADVVVYSATREAVNVWPLEFIVARHLSNLPAGVVVLSEFSGFSRVLNGALRVNPFSQAQLQAALDQALEMPAVEREARARKDLNHISTHTSEDWGTRFLVDLKSMKRKQEEHWMAVGFGLASFRMVGMGADFKALDTQQVLLAYRQSSHRAILVDWGGTITPTVNDLYDQRDQDSYQVPESTLSVLRALCADSSNHVMIVSGLSRDKVQKAFGSVPNLSLAAEHGFHYRIKNGPWRLLLPGLNTSWREVAEAIVSVYTQRTNGSFMQKKGSSIVWNHQQADPEFGTMQARELRYHLQGVLTAFPVVVLVGKGYVEVCPKGVNKGAMAERMIEETMAQDVYDMHGQKQPLQFILCCGDDSSDEQMFSALHSKFGQRPTDLDLFTVTVGRKPSEACSYLTDHNEVVELLKMVGSLHTGRSKRAGAMSVNDLPQFEPHPRDSAISFKGPRRGADSVDGPGFKSLANSAR